MDDHTAQLLLELVTLGNQELDTDQAAAVERYLRAQPELETAIQQEREFDALIGPAIRNIPVPTDLKSRIHTRLASRRGAAHRRRAYQVAAAAASVFLAFGIFWGIRWSTMPRLDAEQIAIHYDPLIQDPFGQAQQWLADRGVAFQPTLPLDPALLTAFEMSTFEGETVPLLIFTNFRENVTARVYVVRSRDFNLDAITTEARQSFCSVQILPDSARPNRLSYIIVYTGHSLQPFLQRGPAPLA